MRRERKKEEKKQTEKMPANKKKILIIALSVIGALIVLAGGAFAALSPGNNIARGVRIEGISVGGKSVESAKEAIAPNGDFKGRKFVLKDTVSGAQRTLSADEIALGYDIDATVDAAYKVGRDSGFFADAATIVKLLFSPVDIPYQYTCDEDALSSTLYDFGVSVNGEQMNYDLELGDGVVTIKSGQSGQSSDVSDLTAAFWEAVQKGESKILLTLEIKDPPSPDVESLYNELYIAPQDAKYEIANGKMTVTPEVAGREIDKEEAKKYIEDIKNGGSATLKLVSIEPEVTEASINAELFGTVLGKFSTSYSTSSKNRSSNVELAASRIDGTILMPNEEFSYNNTVGKRTAANGFKEAPVFENGETVQGMGGGVCQVSSTLYSAVLYADLPVLERQNHSMTVSYVPKGQDATVAYGSIDFRFKNDTKGPIKISAKTAGKVIEISIWGAKPEKEKKVEIINTVTETKAPTTEEVVDPTMRAGQRKVSSNGKTGYTVATVRKVYENGKEVKSEKMPVSKYKMVPTKVLIGSNTVPAFEEITPEDNTGVSDRPSETPPYVERPAPAETPEETPAPAETPSEPVQETAPQTPEEGGAQEPVQTDSGEASE